MCPRFGTFLLLCVRCGAWFLLSLQQRNHFSLQTLLPLTDPAAAFTAAALDACSITATVTSTIRCRCYYSCPSFMSSPPPQTLLFLVRPSPSCLLLQCFFWHSVIALTITVLSAAASSQILADVAVGAAEQSKAIWIILKQLTRF